MFTTIGDWWRTRNVERNRREHLSQTDVAVIKFRQMLKKAWQAERLQTPEVEPRARRVRAAETLTEA